jgi:DNA-binding MarR family transcriptional regulator
MDVETILDNLKREAVRLEAEGHSLKEAYGEALVIVFQRLAEEQAVNPFERRILNTLKTGRPMSATRIAVELGIRSRFSMYRQLRSLEKRGLIYKTGGRHSKQGWQKAA